jgi:hypothetical protein
VEDVLKAHPGSKIRVFAVWEPILLFDSKPGDLVRGRLTDKRVQQYWDANRLVAEEIAHHGDPAQKEPECCFHRRGVLWDFAALYPMKVVWHDRLPLALVFEGPVVQQVQAIDREISRLLGTPKPRM